MDVLSGGGGGCCGPMAWACGVLTRPPMFLNDLYVCHSISSYICLASLHKPTAILSDKTQIHHISILLKPNLNQFEGAVV